MKMTVINALQLMDIFYEGVAKVMAGAYEAVIVR